MTTDKTLKPGELVGPWVVPTWNPATMKSPWPYTESAARIIVKTYRLVKQP